METIFDHNPTDSDLMDIFNTTNHNEINAICRNNPNKLIWAIALLYISRGDRDTAERYIDKIADIRTRMDVKRLLLEPDVIPRL